MKKHSVRIGYNPFRNFIKYFGVFATITLFTVSANAQYEAATWRNFKAAAVTYTFDDNTASQLPTALPLFDQYNFKVTFYPVINWGPNWTGFQTASNNGHEIGSHTVSHVDLSLKTVAEQLPELQTSQSTINTNITNASCVTIAYPFCNIGDLTTLQTYYIAGRVCDGNIELSTPGNFYKISAITAGSAGNTKLAADFNNTILSAKSSKGWCVFLIHAINSDNGYSPTQSAELATHLAFVNANIADYWVAPFRNVVKYIKERNAATFTETTITSDSLQVVVSDNLNNTIYNEPITIRRALPAGWQNANVYSGTQKISSSIVVNGTTSYIVFDAIPDKATVYLAKANTVTAISDLKESTPFKVDPNPFTHTIKIKAEGKFNYHIYTLSGQLVEKGSKVDSTKEIGGDLTAGAYILSVASETNTYKTKIVKI